MSQLIRAPKLSQTPRQLGAVEQAAPPADPVESAEQRQLAEALARAEAAEAALEEARHTFSQWQLEQDAKRNEVLEQAYKEGWEQGINDAQLKIENVLEEQRQAQKTQFETLVDGMHSEMKRCLQQINEDSIVETVLTALYRILGKHLVEAQGVKAVVNETLRDLPYPGRVEICLSAVDYERIQGEEAAANSSRITYTRDERLSAGDCTVYCESGEMIFRLDEALVSMRASLLEVRDRRLRQGVGDE